MNGNWKGKEVTLNYKQKNTVELQKKKEREIIKRMKGRGIRKKDSENKANNGEIRWKKIWIE